MRVRDYLDAKAVRHLGDTISAAATSFDKRKFVSSARRGLARMNLMVRIDHLADCIAACSNAPPEEFVSVIVASLGPPRTEPGYGTYEDVYHLALARYVSRYAIEHFDIALPALREITRRFTSEFDVRPFLQKDSQRTLRILHQWKRDPDLHVRRLVSECTRTRLPWATHLQDYKRRPQPILSLLRYLLDDEERYVQRSVANNLADLLKDNPATVYDYMVKHSEILSPAKQWIFSHAIRYPFMRGDSRAKNLRKEMLAR